MSITNVKKCIKKTKVPEDAKQTEAIPLKKMTEKVPDLIPLSCNDCQYFTRGGGFIIESYLGMCEFYDEKRYLDDECIAVERYSKSPNVASTPIDIDKQKPICPNCETKQDHHDALFCFKCGSDLYPNEMKEVKVCTQCNTQYDLSYEYCTRDGNALSTKKIEVNGNSNHNDSTETTATIDIGNGLQEIEVEENVEVSDNELGFGWGKFWIGMGFIEGGIAFYYYSSRE